MTESKIRILVVEDDDDVRSTVVDAFEEEGFVVHQASSGNKALVLLQTVTVDVLLTDIRMADGSGIDLLIALGKNRSKVPVFVMTGFSDFAMEDAARHGAQGFFSKPFDPSVIVRTIRTKLES